MEAGLLFVWIPSSRRIIIRVRPSHREAAMGSADRSAFDALDLEIIDRVYEQRGPRS